MGPQRQLTTETVTVAVGLSGGIDSSMAAYLLLREGFRVIGLTMQIWDGSLPLVDENRSACYGPGEPRDIEAAARLAQRLGIEHHVIPMAEEYRAEVLDYFRREYLAGRTPNPCVRCNRTMKFGALIRKARESGLQFDFFATGHYARVDRDPDTGRFLLRRGLDAAKDQSYFLSHLDQSQLGTLMLPLGKLTKDTVRELAAEIGWTDLIGKAESQDFIESKDYSVLFRDSDAQPGPITDLEGRVLGQHRGIIHYTVGQRRGIGLGGTGHPLYVVRIDACSNTVVVGTHQDLFSARLRATDLNWIAYKPAPGAAIPVQAKIRQRHCAAQAVLSVPAEGDAVDVEFEAPQMSVTPGQAVVFYDDDLVIGGGIIDRAEPDAGQ